MPKKMEILAEMLEKKSQYNNIYFAGKLEGGSKIVLKKKKEKKGPFGEQVWELFITNEASY